MSAVRRVSALTGSVVLALGVAFATQAAAQASDTDQLPCPQTTTTAPVAASSDAAASCTPLTVVQSEFEADPPTCVPIPGLPPCGETGTASSSSSGGSSSSSSSTSTGTSSSSTPSDLPCIPEIDHDCASETSSSSTTPTVTGPTSSTESSTSSNPPSSTGGNGHGTPGGGRPTRTTTAPTGGVGRGNAGVDASVGQGCSGLLCADSSYRDRIAAEERARAARAAQQRPAAATPGVAQLARTGSELTSTATLAGGLLLVGGTLLLVRRRFAAGYDRRH